MKLEEIFECWGKDVHIDRNDLCAASLDISKLHNKYLRMFSGERLLTKKLESDFVILKDDKKSWMAGSMAKDDLDSRGWSPWLRARPLKNEISDLLAVDPDVIKAQLRLDLQREKVEVLDSIMKMIMNRSFHVNGATTFLKFQNGVA